jgi:hypothetical protein
MGNVEQVLAEVTPRRATMALLRFEEMIAECERRTGGRLTETDMKFLLTVFRSVVVRECRATRADGAT